MFIFTITSVPEPGRNVLMLMVLPGAGNWASMMALISGCTSAGDRALLLSTSSSTCRVHEDTLRSTWSDGNSEAGRTYLGEQVEATEVAHNAVDFRQAFAPPTGLEWRKLTFRYIKKY